MQIQPLRDLVLVSKEEETKTTESGLIMMSNPKTTMTGTILTVGPGYASEAGITPLQVKTGDRVCFNKGGVQEVTEHGETAYLMSEANILYVIGPKA